VASGPRRILEHLDRPVAVWIAGVFWPIVMVVLDPAIFQDPSGQPFLGVIKPFCYVAILGGVVASICDVSFAHGFALLAGVLGAAAAFAGFLGIAMLPLTFIGLILFGLGLLGLSPFVSAVVLWRRATRAYATAHQRRRTHLCALGVASYFGICGIAQWRASAALADGVTDMCSASPPVAAAGTERLRRWRYLLDLDQMALEWTDARDETRKQCLATAYQRLTGGNIHERSSELSW
jgi:hypothetical protein